MGFRLFCFDCCLIMFGGLRVINLIDLSLFVFCLVVVYCFCVPLICLWVLVFVCFDLVCLLREVCGW